MKLKSFLNWSKSKLSLSIFLTALFLTALLFLNCISPKITESQVGLGWSRNSINTVIFRSNAITTYKEYQFTAYYNTEGKLVLAKRKLGNNQWETKISKYFGNVKDAHNSISIAVDGNGFLHVSWDQHDTRLRYAKSKQPLSLELTDEMAMTGLQEKKVTYPEFHNLPHGNLLFCYRSGKSGRGNMVINKYNLSTKKWTQLQNNLLDGEEQRSAYWQTAIGENGAIYISWVWRETWDVSTNHDMCFAVSYDEGLSWQKSNGEKYTLPITVSTAEIAWKIPQNSNLINQTSMTIDREGNPYIATYWSEDGFPQYSIIFLKNGQWQLLNTNFQNTNFNLGGGGTKSIPISRPKILIKKNSIYLLFRTKERSNKITLAITTKNHQEWKLFDITEQSVGQWEPNYDVELWKSKNLLHIFSQKVVQIDGEGLAEVNPQPVKILEINNIFND